MQPHLASAATTHPVHFVVFITLVIGFLWVDLASGKTDRPVSMLKAATWSGIWVAVSLAFAGYVASIRGTDDAILFLTAYALEKSLAVDNLFVFLAIFRLRHSRVSAPPDSVLGHHWRADFPCHFHRTGRRAAVWCAGAGGTDHLRLAYRTPARGLFWFRPGHSVVGVCPLSRRAEGHDRRGNGLHQPLGCPLPAPVFPTGLRHSLIAGAS